MRKLTRIAAALMFGGAVAASAAAQAPPGAPPAGPVATPPGTAPAPAAQPAKPEIRPTGVAATVNNAPIEEVAVYRALKQWPENAQEAARKEIVNHLVENLLIDQYLTALQIKVDEKEVDKIIGELKEELAKEKPPKSFVDELTGLMLTEAEFRVEVAAQMRWDKFVQQQGTDAELQKLFTGSPEVFNGTMVKARHILIKPDNTPANSPQAVADKLKAIKANVEAEMKKVLDAMPPTATPVEKETARRKRADEVFAAYAKDHSICPSKQNGGDLNYFPRSGAMVEPFAKVAFSLKPYEMSDVVTTEFGSHLILVTDRQEGKPKEFTKVKDDVRMMYAMRLREAVIAQMKPKAQITINPPPATSTTSTPAPAPK